MNMSKTFSQKRDLKALSTLGVDAAVQVANENGGNNKVIFVTSFGLVIPEKILAKEIDPDDVNGDNLQPFTIFNALKNTKDLLAENQNDDILDEQTAFVLENVEIRPFGSSGNTYLGSMILFSDQIVGLSMGSLSVD